MDKLTHWTEASTDDYLYKISSDFMRQIAAYLGGIGAKQNELAAKIGVTPSRVSQVLNNPGNVTLKRCVQYARAIGKKVAVVVYDDNDPQNVSGPVNGQIFERCWVEAGRPADFFALEDAGAFRTFVIMADDHASLPIALSATKSTTRGSSVGLSLDAATYADNRLDLGQNVGASNNG